ncbi:MULTISPECIES: RNA methyltransferase [Actinomadura]|uniref:RNA methyltransferase n=1 Tax=Actinomadura litoris TaxID=2678616 RepID=A0A7K1LDL1_9ACTN|nr:MULTISPECIES: RNA methyltransferase [Actinomadura]MBT2213990.1 RNA methyltransferase [Actinomadura sp. NEAU-AAG7]MUN42265.1 RNA methyltransferase [Actinomadura litoris]
MAGRELTSLRSPRVKAARRLAKRAFRRREGRFLAEGPQAVREALRIPGGLAELFTTAEAEARHPELVAAAEQAGAPVLRVSGEVMAELAQTVTPQGLLAVCGFLDVPLGTALETGPELVTVLAHVRDPGNAGTVLRTADAAGSEAVVFTDASVDPYNGKCVRASAGSLFHLPVVVGPRFDTLVPELRGAGLTILAADGAGERTLDEGIDDGLLARPTAWVFGNEAWGLPEEILRHVDEVVRVPIHGRAESLNLATAAAVCLYASARAQRSQRERSRS